MAMPKPGRRILVLLGLGVLGLGVLGWVLFRPARGLNVILITVDTLRADHLGVYGYRRNTSPHLDRFAKEGILFRQAFAHAPSTNPSLSSLMTSHYPHETTVLHVFNVLPQGVVTMAEILKEAGYRTAAIISHFTLRRGSGFEQGFDMYDDQMGDSVPVRHDLSASKLYLRVERVAPKTTRAALTWLEGHAKKQPFFLWVHYDDPHGPYTPPAPYSTIFVEPSTGGTTRLPINGDGSGKGGIPLPQQLGAHRDPAYYIAQYDGEIRFLDDALGVLLQKIQELGLFDNTLLIFTADHGEGMGEHNYYFDHPEFLYNGLIQVPLILWVPGFAGGKEVRVPVAHVDVVPTILDIVGIKVSQPFRGQSLLTPREEREVFAEAYREGSKYALIFKGMKLIWSGVYYELYDLRNDAAEVANLMGKGMDETLFARLDAIRNQDALNIGSPLVWALDAELRKQLRALGYIQ